MRSTSVCTIAVGLALAGCVSLEPPLPPTDFGQKPVHERNYTLGQPLSAAVGEPVVRVKSYTLSTVTTDNVEADRDFEVHQMVRNVSGTKGQRLAVVSVRRVHGETWRIVEFPKSRATDGMALQIDPQGRIGNKILNGMHNNEGPFGGGKPTPVEVFGTATVTPPDVRLLPVTETKITPTAQGGTFEVLFTGSDDQSMHFLYREYATGDFTRASSTQVFSYPIAARTLRFRKLVIDVLEIDPKHISYRVAEDGLS